MHVKAAQGLVNAQTKVNRAVFAMNAEEDGARRFGGKPTPTYILDMIHDAMRDLSVARRILHNQQRKETNAKTKEKNRPDKPLAHQASSASSSQKTVGEIT